MSINKKTRGKGRAPKIFVDELDATKRMSICRQCEHFRPKTTQCAQCKCIMKMKVRLKGAECPIGKWS